MAIMHPVELPYFIVDDPLLHGEIDTYEALQELSDEFVVFYQCYANLDSSSRAHERPIDFVVLHRKLGLLAIEVKGGRIRLGQETVVEHFYEGKWNPSDPYGQIKRGTIELIRNCRADGANYWITDNTCVIFPNTKRSDITNTPHLLPNGTLCEEDMGTLSVQIKTLFSKPREEYAFTERNFLDMQRRVSQRIDLTKRRRGGNKREFFEKKTHEKSEQYRPPKTTSHYRPQNNYVKYESPSQIRRKKIRAWRRAAKVIIMGIIVFVTSVAAFTLLIDFIRNSN